MRRPIWIALLAGLTLAALAAQGPAASAYKTYSSSNRFFEQQAADPSGASILLNVIYAKRTPSGKSTPRQVYVQFRVPVSCQTGGGTEVFVASVPFKLSHQKVEFSGSFPNQAAPRFNPGTPGTDYVTGRLVKKKNKKKWRMEGTATVLTYDSPPAFLGCSSAEIPYSAPRCTWSVPTQRTPPPCAVLTGP